MISNSRWGLLAVFIVAAIALCAAAEDAASTPAAELHAAYGRLEADYRRELAHLAHVAFSRGWAELGEAATAWRPATPTSGSLVFIAPDQYSPGAALNMPLAEESSSDAQPWLDRFAALRRQQGAALFELAKQAAEVGQLSLGFQWATEALREDPDHADARRVLGYENRDGQWLTAYGARMADAGKMWHPKFGWIEPEHIAKYEAGERLVGGRWRMAATEAARRANIQNGWQVRTDHFLVTTNHSLEAAAELAARLERLHQVWRQMFAGFHLSEREVRQLFAGERNGRTPSRPFRVFYHRDRGEYAAALARRQPRIAETLGIYFDTQREAHFFAGEDVAAGGSPASVGRSLRERHPLAERDNHTDATGGPPVATLYHEAVHQLFQESKPAARHVGSAANFWIVEGIATYFETLTEQTDPHAGLYYTVGEAAAGRLPAARQRLLSDGYYIPLAELTSMGKDHLQQHPDLAKLYSQSTGLAAFLMDAEGGRYREPLVRYLSAVYAGRDSHQTLAEVAGVGYEELDAQYRRYLQSLP